MKGRRLLLRMMTRERWKDEVVVVERELLMKREI
jgi:hypothetical protein